jgi:hypothetical protein
MEENYKKLNDFPFEIFPRETCPEACASKSDFILRSGEKKINGSLNRRGLDLISLKCVERLDLDFRFDFFIEHNDFTGVEFIIFGFTFINIKTIDRKHTIKVFFYVISNMIEDLVLSHLNCWKLGLKDFFTPILSCSEDGKDF